MHVIVNRFKVEPILDAIYPVSQRLGVSFALSAPLYSVT